MPAGLESHGWWDPSGISGRYGGQRSSQSGGMAIARVSSMARDVPSRAGAPQDHAADGWVARSNRPGRAEGADRLGHGRHPGPPGHGARRHPPPPRRGAAQLPRGAAVARRATSRPARHRVARAPRTPPWGGAAGQEAATPERPVEEYTPTSTASAVAPARAHRFTSGHSALGRFW